MARLLYLQTCASHSSALKIRHDQYRSVDPVSKSIGTRCLSVSEMLFELPMDATTASLFCSRTSKRWWFEWKFQVELSLFVVPTRKLCRRSVPIGKVGAHPPNNGRLADKFIALPDVRTAGQGMHAPCFVGCSYIFVLTSHEV